MAAWRPLSQRITDSWSQLNKTKQTMIKRLVLLLFVGATLAFGVTACHTVHGAGEDISTAGNKIQDHTPP